MSTQEIRFRPGRTVARFITSRARVKGIRGPIGSGKTSGGVWAMMQEIFGQPILASGKRRARWLVARNSYRELQDTVMRSFWDWFPPASLGAFRAGDMVQEIVGPDIEAEILFRSLDRPDSVRKLLSLELSGALLSEAREFPLMVVNMLEGRIGRYPPRREGGDGRRMLLMDTNPPDVSHWWPEMFERVRPAGWEQFEQPSGLDAEAENIANLPPNYYTELMAGKSEEWIRVYVHGRYGYLAEGRPVFPEFAASVHAAERIEWDGSAVLVGLDFGRTPAAAICQETVGGGLEQIGELTTTDTGAATFARELRKILAQRYQGKVGAIYGDPSGDTKDGGRSGGDEMTVFQILAANGIHATPAPTQDPTLRREGLAGMMRRMTLTGYPAYRVSSSDCPVTVKGLSGFYRFTRVLSGGLEPRFQDKPEKNQYSHVCEALEYLAVGLGEGLKVITINRGARRDALPRKRVAVI